jgi:hypothetical protein
VSPRSHPPTKGTTMRLLSGLLKGIVVQKLLAKVLGGRGRRV